MFSEEHLYSIALRKCSLIGDINFHKLVSAIGSAKEVWTFPKRELSKILGIGTRTVTEIGAKEPLIFAENELKFCEKHQVNIKLRHKKEIHPLLAECEDAPSIIYQKGELKENFKNLSIVGTRNITHYGKQFLQDFFNGVKIKNLATISGLALGVDAEVHQQSLKNDIPTAGVLAHGFHTFYPAKNKKLAENILEKGGVLMTEFNSSQKPDRENFIQRNRVIAGLSETTIVVETAFGGGSVNTVAFANTYNREVYALPGNIYDKYSQGCNHLILNNKARVISTVSDLLDELKLNTTENIPELFPKSEKKAQLTEDQKIIYTYIEDHPKINADELAQISDIPAHKILPVVLELELLGLVRSISGRQFIIN